MSKKKVDTNNLNDIFNTHSDVVADMQETVDNITPQESIEDFNTVSLSIIRDTQELITRVKEEIKVGHFETEDQKTSLFDSASKLIDNLTKVITAFSIRENNILRHHREEKRFDLDCRKVDISERKIDHSIQLENNQQLLDQDKPTEPGQLTQNNNIVFAGSLTDLIKEINEVEEAEVDVIDIITE